MDHLLDSSSSHMVESTRRRYFSQVAYWAATASLRICAGILVLFEIAGAYWMEFNKYPQQIH
jgi:hypothetical protein